MSEMGMLRYSVHRFVIRINKLVCGKPLPGMLQFFSQCYVCNMECDGEGNTRANSKVREDSSRCKWYFCKVHSRLMLGE